MKTVAETLDAPVRHFDHVKWPLRPFQARDFAVYCPTSLKLIPDSACFAPQWGRQCKTAIFHAVQPWAGCDGVRRRGRAIPVPGRSRNYRDVVSFLDKTMGQILDILGDTASTFRWIFLAHQTDTQRLQ